MFTPKILKPTASEQKEFLQLLILPSKHKGRPDYLAAKIHGSYKPVFISSIYEARTQDGLFNVEVCGIRYEATKTAEGLIHIYEYTTGRKEVTLV